MTDSEIISEITRWPARFIVLTGGEPALQADKTLIDALHDNGYTVAMETNGTVMPPDGIDWLTVSPKWLHGAQVPLAVRHCNELKVIFGAPGDDIWGGESCAGRDDVWKGVRDDGVDIIESAPARQSVSKIALSSLVRDLDDVLDDIRNIDADYYYLQPCDVGDSNANRRILNACVDYVLKHPVWRLSLQTHKLIGIR